MDEEVETFNTIYPGQLRVNDDGSYILTIPVQPRQIPFTIIYTSNVPTPYRFKTNVTLSFLPPVTVTFQVVEHKPIIQISALWLSLEHIKQFVQEFETRYDLYGAVTYVLCQLVEEFVPAELTINDFEATTLSRLDRQNLLLQYNFEQANAAFFAAETHCCCVCYEDKAPIEFTILQNCGHSVCNECLRGSVENALSSGICVFCPEADCLTEVLPNELLVSCGKELVEQYDRQVTLLCIQKIGDYMLCPFCGEAILIDKLFFKKRTAIQCPSCLKSFCSLCQKRNHVGNCVVYDTDYFHSKQYVQSIYEELLSKSLKHCPNCHSPVVKSYGCNKIDCICGSIFCYQCLALIRGYDHFQKACPLFSEEILVEDNRDVDVDTTELKQMAKMTDHYPFFCPKCKQLSAVHHKALVVQCDHCPYRKCLHCNDEDVSKEHVLVCLRYHSPAENP